MFLAGHVELLRQLMYTHAGHIPLLYISLASRAMRRVDIGGDPVVIIAAERRLKRSVELVPLARRLRSIPRSTRRRPCPVRGRWHRTQRPLQRVRTMRSKPSLSA